NPDLKGLGPEARAVPPKRSASGVRHKIALQKFSIGRVRNPPESPIAPPTEGNKNPGKNLAPRAATATPKKTGKRSGDVKTSADRFPVFC
ncbi:hypothetical protein, partial [Phormidium sp. CCY1219]|uniref:hypothetical protein n=1 Tax=Phormidium sp. CCY1219 TaxID=2886104 RepID=UPI002D1EF339